MHIEREEWERTNLQIAFHIPSGGWGLKPAEESLISQRCKSILVNQWSKANEAQQLSTLIHQTTKKAIIFSTSSLNDTSSHEQKAIQIPTHFTYWFSILKSVKLHFQITQQTHNKPHLQNIQPKPVLLQKKIDFSLIRLWSPSPTTPRSSNHQSSSS